VAADARASGAARDRRLRAFREGLERLAATLARGDLDAAATLGENGQEPAQLRAFLERLEDRAGYAAAAAGLRDRVAWAGSPDHAELADLLPRRRRWPSPARSRRRSAWSPRRPRCGALPVVADPPASARSPALGAP
jgi:hypothetical protein